MMVLSCRDCQRGNHDAEYVENTHQCHAKDRQAQGYGDDCEAPCLGVLALVLHVCLALVCFLDGWLFVGVGRSGCRLRLCGNLGGKSVCLLVAGHGGCFADCCSLVRVCGAVAGGLEAVAHGDGCCLLARQKGTEDVLEHRLAGANKRTREQENKRTRGGGHTGTRAQDGLVKTRLTGSEKQGGDLEGMYALAPSILVHAAHASDAL
ncbi:hypothetical protein PMIN03_013111 [Paraphaeosphaeria minitans]